MHNSGTCLSNVLGYKSHWGENPCCGDLCHRWSLAPFGAHAPTGNVHEHVTQRGRSPHLEFVDLVLDLGVHRLDLLLQLPLLGLQRGAGRRQLRHPVIQHKRSDTLQCNTSQTPCSENSSSYTPETSNKSDSCSHPCFI